MDEFVHIVLHGCNAKKRIVSSETNDKLLKVREHKDVVETKAIVRDINL